MAPSWTGAITLANSAELRNDNSLKRVTSPVGGQQPTIGWIPQGRDVALEQTILAHIHTQLWGGGYEPQYNEDLNFGDDPFLSDGDRRRSEAAGRFAWICTAKPDAGGTLRCTHNLRLKPHGDRFEGSIRHGLDSPPE